MAKAMPEMLATQGQPPSHLADEVGAGIENGRFYIVVEATQGSGMNLGSAKVMELRHRRLEIGAPCRVWSSP